MRFHFRLIAVAGILGLSLPTTGCGPGQPPGAPGGNLGRPEEGNQQVAAASGPRVPPGGQALDGQVDPSFQPPPVAGPAGPGGAPGGGTVDSDRGPWRFPVAGRATFDNGFGQGTHSRPGSPFNNGIDIMADRGTPVVSPVAGTVRKSENGLGGNTVTVTADEGTQYYMAHLDAYAEGLTDGQRVEPGSPIGTVGNTGNAASTPPHLHFCPVKNGEAWNPYDLLVRSQQASGQGPA